MDSVFLISDIICVCNCYSVNIGIVSLDQERVFERVNG